MTGSVRSVAIWCMDIRQCVDGLLYSVSFCLVMNALETAAHCNTLQHTATARSCRAFQCATVRCRCYHQRPRDCNTLQHTANTPHHTLRAIMKALETSTHCNTLQHTAAHCNTLHHTPHAIINALETSTYCNTLQHITPRTLRVIMKALVHCVTHHADCHQIV